ncbi:MAG: carbohydrate ABC transporter permease [Clostridiales bacterium]|jgi:ABC-type glycerol-3-phosphate transport system permease component|nr:carbohydrate ABC transporter permease [Clostridiales bacterium]
MSLINKHNKHIFQKKRTGQGTLSRSAGGTAAILAFLALAGMFMVLPVLYTVVTAFKPLHEMFYWPPRFFVREPTLANFTMLFEIVQDMWAPLERYVFNSVFVSALGTALYVFVASMAAYPLAKYRSKVLEGIYWVVVLAIMFRPEVTRIPQYVIMSGLGLVNTYAALILPALASSFGVFLMRQFMTEVPVAMLEAARIDGASEYVIFFGLMLPMTRPAWLTLIIFTFTQLWNMNGAEYVYEESMKPLAAVFAQIASAGIARAGAGAAVALLMMVPPYAVFIFSQSSVMETMAHTGIK